MGQPGAHLDLSFLFFFFFLMMMLGMELSHETSSSTQGSPGARGPCALVPARALAPVPAGWAVVTPGGLVSRSVPGNPSLGSVRLSVT